MTNESPSRVWPMPKLKMDPRNERGIESSVSDFLIIMYCRLELRRDEQ